MENSGIVGQLRNKCILITGATGFLAKIFVEKVLRVQPNVKKLFLLVRAADDKLAMQRLQNEVIDQELFNLLREEHGKKFDSFIKEKVVPIQGDITLENLGIDDAELREKLFKEINIVVNVAATTNFYERYDVSLAVNVLGAKHTLEFAKKCVKIEMLLHVSTAYVNGDKVGAQTEKAYQIGETLNGNSDLDIEAELKLVEEVKAELRMQNSADNVEKTTMKELGLKRARNFGWPNTYVFTKAMGEMMLGHLRGNLPLVILRPSIITGIYKEPLPGWIEGTRTIDSLVVGYAKGNLPCFFGDLSLIMDVIPGDMVVNSMIVSLIWHLNQESQTIYHICSSTRNPVDYNMLMDCGYQYFCLNPRIGKNGKAIKTRKIPVFKIMSLFRGYMILRYKFPLEVLHLVNFALCGMLSQRYNELSRMYNYVMRLVDLYEPYAFYKGWFDDTNAESLRIAMSKLNCNDAKIFDFDPKNINWEDYLPNVHIPGVIKYVCK